MEYFVFLLKISMIGFFLLFDCFWFILNIRFFFISVFICDEIVDLFNLVILDNFVFEIGEFLSIFFNNNFWFIFLIKVWFVIFILFILFV